jgi:hypothetical protein
MPDHGGMNRPWRLGLILQTRDYARGDSNQRKDNQDRNDGPGYFNLITAVNLRGFIGIAAFFVAKTDHRVNDQSANHNENGAGYSQDQQGKIENGVRGRSERLKHISHPMFG